MKMNSPTPKCRYCGAEMYVGEPAARVLHGWGVNRRYCVCGVCGSRSPVVHCLSDEPAIAAAMQRWQEPNAPVALEEVKAWGNTEVLPIWLEIRYLGGTITFGASLYGGIDEKGIHLYQDGMWNAHPIARYGQRFRIWLRRPTDAEREATAWKS